MTEFVDFKCKSVSGWLTVPIPTLLPFNNTSPVPSGSNVMSPLVPSANVKVPELVPLLVLNMRSPVPCVVMVALVLLPEQPPV